MRLVLDSISEHDHEMSFLRNLFDQLSSPRNAPSLPAGLIVVATKHLHELPLYGRRNVIVILVSDEYHTAPSYSHRVLAVFKNYPNRFNFSKYRGLSYRASNVFPIPLPASQRVPELPHADYDKAEVDVFFSGQRIPARYAFFDACSPLVESPDVRTDISATGGFSLGLPPESFAAKLAQTLIALAPAGFVSEETFRLTEALRAGCSVVTLRKPRTWFYNGSPIVQLNNWRELPEAIERLLADRPALIRRCRESRAWWEAHFDASPVADYITAAINGLSGGYLHGRDALINQGMKLQGWLFRELRRVLRH